MIRGRHDPRARWQAAQEAELAFWRDWRSIPTFRDFDPQTYWERQFRRLGVSAPSLRRQSVVEVGCGPFGAIFYLPPCAKKLAIDPLAGRFARELGRHALPATGDVALLQAMGERLPLRDQCADLAICYNVLDHAMTPAAVLDEIHRILRPDGRLWLMSHTFPAALCPFLGFDKPHPHHWSMAQLLDLVRSRGFRIDRYEREPIGFPVTWRTLFDPRVWKQLAANLVVSCTHLTARPDLPSQ